MISVCTVVALYRSSSCPAYRLTNAKWKTVETCTYTKSHPGRERERLPRGGRDGRGARLDGPRQVKLDGIGGGCCKRLL